MDIEPRKSRRNQANPVLAECNSIRWLKKSCRLSPDRPPCWAWSRRIRWKVTLRSSQACASDTPGFRRPAICSTSERSALSHPSSSSTCGNIWIGHQISGLFPTTNPENWRGVTPTTVRGTSSSVMTFPITAESCPKRRTQKSWLITATGCGSPERSSFGVSVRPRAACTPRTEKKLPETAWVHTGSASTAASPVVLILCLPIWALANRPENELLLSRRRS